MPEARFEAATHSVEKLCKLVAAVAKAVRLPVRDPLKEFLLVASPFFAAGNGNLLRVKMFHQDFVQVELLKARKKGNCEHARNNL